MDIYSLPVLEAVCNPGVRRAALLPEVLQEDPSCLFQLLGLQASLACGYITLISASVITWPLHVCLCVLPSYKDTCHWI